MEMCSQNPRKLYFVPRNINQSIEYYFELRVPSSCFKLVRLCVTCQDLVLIIMVCNCSQNAYNQAKY